LFRLIAREHPHYVPSLALAALCGMRHARGEGAVCENLAIDRLREIARTAGFSLAENGFRHTWISARVEITGDIPRAALEAGTSVAKIHQHYRELLRSEAAAAWFAVTPESIS